MKTFITSKVKLIKTYLRYYTTRNRFESKIFCISFQRTGTTSTGKFFMMHGFPVANWYISRNSRWTRLWFNGEYEQIFNSFVFKHGGVFEDDPWWCLDFYKVLFHRFPDSKFILFTRDSDKWFNSMVSHSKGKTLGNTQIHTKLYGRELEYLDKFGDHDNNNRIDNLLDLNETHRSHYKKIYELRNQEIMDFFNKNDPSRLINLKLEDDDKWQKLGNYFNIKVDLNFKIHANASKR